MKVKAKWAIKVNGEWRKAGDVFEVSSIDDIGNAVDVLQKEPKPVQVKLEEIPEEKPEVKAEPKSQRAARTRKRTNE